MTCPTDVAFAATLLSLTLLVPACRYQVDGGTELGMCRVVTVCVVGDDNARTSRSQRALSQCFELRTLGGARGAALPEHGGPTAPSRGQRGHTPQRRSLVCGRCMHTSQRFGDGARRGRAECTASDRVRCFRVRCFR
jgi:hypothetical protein